MRVGFVVPQLNGGGAEVVARRWIGELTRRGHSVHTFTYVGEASDAASDGVKQRHFPYRSRLARALLLPSWLRINAARGEVDVVVSVLTFTNLAVLVGFRLLVPSRTPLVISEHTVLTLALPLSSKRWRVKRWLARRLYRRADAVAAASHSVAADLIGGFRVRPDRAFVVPNPIVEDREIALAQPLPQTLKVGFVGRLTSEKRPELFIRTVTELAAKGVRISAVIIGDGPLRGRLEASASASHHPFAFEGWLSEWWNKVPDLDCLVLPSIVEGFGNVLVEAAAAGIPCVAVSNALGVSDALVPGVTGELARNSEPEALADAVLRATRPRGRGVGGWLSTFSVDSSTTALLHAIQASTRDA